MQQQFDEFYDLVISQTSTFSLEQLKTQRRFLTVAVYSAFRMKEDVERGYINLDTNFIDSTIQRHTELRNKTIDAIGGR